MHTTEPGATTSGPVRIIVVDDDPLTRSAILPLLRPREEFEVVAQADDGQEAVHAVAHHRADVVLMDLGMPVMDGIEATRRICAAAGHPHVVALTTWDVDDAVVRAIEAGAEGYLLKVSAPKELVPGLRRVVAGDSPLSPGAMRTLLAHVRSRGQAVASGGVGRAAAGPGSLAEAGSPCAGLPGTGQAGAGAPRTRLSWSGGTVPSGEGGARLTDREREVVQAAAEGLTTEQIAARLYVSASTVKTHLRSAQERMGASNRVQLAVLAERAGLLGQVLG
ncbi:DNA-binding response regulator [Actinomyces lilanjuaniae]|uniref:DNA-binding response regulator n=1 Tax=Actinomyces lilanjuaniae TaxID=2321394 RepID=A0ABM6Z5I5_9ACTO|nr:response regulator transcription factor [Actinomyces lilanjuaniae]AYD90652.1 DNA-binding response regulator [Actinomyces lilanjuaniae]